MAAPQCVHRGYRVGVLECQCGSLYHCNLLGKLCSKKAPIDNLVHAIVGDEKIRLTDDVYQCCAGCDRKELQASLSVDQNSPTES